MDTSASEFLHRNEKQHPAHEKEMLQACRTGGLSQLQQVYQTHNIQPGAKLDWTEKDDWPSTTVRLFIAAIIHEHAPILRYLLFMHSGKDFHYPLVVQAIIDHPNMEIMEPVRAHQPAIVNLEFNHLQTFLTEAYRGSQECESPVSSKTLSLIHCLLDNGADP